MRWPILLNRPSFLIVDVDEFTGVLAFVATHRLGRFQAVEAIEAEPAQDAAGGGRRDADLLCDLLAGPARAPQHLELCDSTVVSLAMKPFGMGGAIRGRARRCRPVRINFAEVFQRGQRLRAPRRRLMNLDRDRRLVFLTLGRLVLWLVRRLCSL